MGVGGCVSLCLCAFFALEFGGAEILKASFGNSECRGPKNT